MVKVKSFDLTSQGEEVVESRVRALRFLATLNEISSYTAVRDPKHEAATQFLTLLLQLTVRERGRLSSH